MYAVKISHTVPLENPLSAKRRPSAVVPGVPAAPGTMISAAPNVTPMSPMAAAGIGSRISAAITVTNNAKNCHAWAEAPRERAQQDGSPEGQWGNRLPIDLHASLLGILIHCRCARPVAGSSPDERERCFLATLTFGRGSLMDCVNLLDEPHLGC